VICAEDAAEIERATLKALPAKTRVEDDGWILSANDGAIGRANSVTPLAAGSDPLDAKIDRALAFYAAHALPPKFRVSPFAQPPGLTEALTARGFRNDEPTTVMTLALAGAFARDPGVELIATPDAPWRALFAGPGISAAQAEIRAETLARGEGTVFARVTEGDDTVAIGALSISDGWASVHGMRTREARRGSGFGGAILARLLDEARERGARRCFLQVETPNPATRLYRRVGFAAQYEYAYWR
jgi:GNAT superfamily N-acetyltransferase